MVNDSVGSSNLKEFKRRFPDRLINVGIAEQNLVGVSAGLASAGKIPFTCGASCFLTGRALEQIKADLAYSRHNVKLCGMSSGMAYGELGPTHHSIEDLAWTRAIANLTVIVPADPVETAAAVRAAAAIDGPVFLRLSRMPVPAVAADAPTFEIGRAAPLRDGRDVTIIAAGVTVARALEAAALLAADGISAAVLNLSTIRPIDREAIAEAARRGPIVTVEEHTVYGGLGQRGRGGRRHDRIRCGCACSACPACSRRPAPRVPAGALRPRRREGIREPPATRSAWSRERDLMAMPANHIVLAIDQGTTNTKVLLFDERGAVDGTAQPAGADRVSRSRLGRAGRRAPLAKRRGRDRRVPVDARRAGGRRRRRHQPARVRAGLGTRHRAASRPGHRLAVPPDGGLLRDARGTRPAAQLETATG